MVKNLRKTREKEERKIIKFIFEGCSNSEIAKALNYSRSTISYRLNTIFEKYYVKTRHELILAIVAKLTAKNKEIILKQEFLIDELKEQIKKRDLILKNIIFDFENTKKTNKNSLQNRINEAKTLFNI